MPQTPNPSPAENTGVQRRTLIKTAAWATPVIVLSTAAPAVAASLVATLYFAVKPAAVAACGVSQTGVIQLTKDGSTPAAAGVMVTVTLATGLTWANADTTARALPTDAAGQVHLTGSNAIAGTGIGGDYTVTASAPGLVVSDATATLTVTNSLTSFYVKGTAVPNTFLPVSGIPTGVVVQTSISGGYAMAARTSDGSVYMGNPVATAPTVTKVTGLSGPATWVDVWYGGPWVAIAAGGRSWVVPGVGSAASLGPVPASVNVVRQAIGTNGIVSASDTGDLWYYDPTNIPGGAKAMPGLASGAADYAVYVGDGRWCVVAGKDGVPYLCTPYSLPQFYPVSGVEGRAVQARVGASGMIFRDDLGKVYYGIPEAHVTGGNSVTAISGLAAPATDIATYDGGGMWAVAIAGGVGYIVELGSIANGFIPIAGPTNLTQITIGAGTISAIDANGVVWTAPPVTTTPKFTQGPTVPPVTAMDAYWADGTWLAVAATPVCPVP